jgi:hypothetical protein
MIFAQQLHLLRLRELKVVADGNCLYRALGEGMDGTSMEINHATLRREVTNFMRSNKAEFRDYVESARHSSIHFTEYVDEAAKDGVWAGVPEIKAFVRCFQYSVVVHRHGKEPQRYGSSARTIDITYNDVNYYNGTVAISKAAKVETIEAGVIKCYTVCAFDRDLCSRCDNCEGCLLPNSCLFIPSKFYWRFHSFQIPALLAIFEMFKLLFVTAFKIVIVSAPFVPISSRIVEQIIQDFENSKMGTTDTETLS